MTEITAVPVENQIRTLAVQPAENRRNRICQARSTGVATGPHRFPLRAIRKHQPGRFFFAFFPNAGFAGDALASCGCPA